MCSPFLDSKNGVIDIEELNKKYDRIISTNYIEVTDEIARNMKQLVIDVIYAIKKNKGSPLSQKYLKDISRLHDFSGKNSVIFQAYQKLVDADDPDVSISDMEDLRNTLKIKRCKSQSGVLVITIFTSPYPEYIDKTTNERVKQKFSCHWNCAYCPAEPDQPRSYLKGEPGVLRANKNNFECVKQMWDRMKTLYTIGHNVDKLEVLVLGGTWVSYPLEYREEFVRDIYYAANTFWDAGNSRRPPEALEFEKRQNQTARTRVIGLTLETRPDTIDADEIKRLRSYGCTRVQLGVQHLNDNILQQINRRCTTAQTIKAIKLLKDACFKIDAHFMPNLPSSTPELDRDMMVDKLLGMKTPIIQRNLCSSSEDEEHEFWQLSHPEFQVDQWKVYPCAITPWTDIEKWYKEGTYKPYSEEALVDILLDMKTLIFPWIRLNRIIRDIPTDYIIDSSDKPNLRQELAHILEAEGKRCNCIRCREVKGANWNGDYCIRVRRYDASEGIEYFIAAESRDANVLYGFIRLRICQPNTDAFPELEGCGLIRELHVYGQLHNVGHTSNHVQHKGIGKKLIAIAERVAYQTHGRTSIAIIAGEGTKKYYEKNGYTEDTSGEGSFMIKKLMMT